MHIRLCVYTDRYACLVCKYSNTLENQCTHTAKRSCMWFAGNGIGDEGAKQLAKSLEKNTTLTSLGLRGIRWCNATPAVVSTCIHTCGYCAAMQSQTKPNVNPGISADLMIMLTVTLTPTLPLTLTITLTLNPVP